MAKTYIENMLGENERIILVTRQHGFVLFSSIIAEIVVTLIVLVAISALTALVNPLAGFGFLLVLIPLAHHAAGYSGLDQSSVYCHQPPRDPGLRYLQQGCG